MNKQTKFYTTMHKASLCHNKDTYIIVKPQGFSLTDWLREASITKINNENDFDVIIPVYNLLSIALLYYH